MLKIKEYEGKSLEEAKLKALEELNANENELYIIDNVVESGKLFKSTKHVIKVIEKVSFKDYLKQVLKEISENLKIDINSEIRVDEDIYNVVIITSNNALLIGKEGKTLEALQLLLRQIIKNQTGLNIKINLDIANYKNNKIKTLEREVKKIAREVQKTKIEASLDPMNSYERRIIHNMINDMPNLETESVGEDKMRHIIIKYVEEK